MDNKDRRKLQPNPTGVDLNAAAKAKRAAKMERLTISRKQGMQLYGSITFLGWVILFTTESAVWLQQVYVVAVVLVFLYAWLLRK